MERGCVVCVFLSLPSPVFSILYHLQGVDIGDLAEVALYQGPYGSITVGAPGGWNSTVYPKWYFNQVNKSNEMTDAEIRGGLDDGTEYRACNRKTMYAEVAPTTTIQDQNFLDLMLKLNLGDFGSKVTVIDGQDRVPLLVDAIYTIDVETNFTQNAYNTHSKGMDIPKALEQDLVWSMQGILDDENTKNVAGGRSKIVLFIPRDTVNLNSENLDIARNRMTFFRENLPVPIRLTNPNCGSDWSAQPYNQAEFTYSVKHYGVNYHRLQANYFYGQGSAEITVKADTSVTLKVCFSRKNAFPDSNSTSDTSTECQHISSSNNYKYQLTQTCQDYEYLSQCPPLYVSVTSVGNTKSYNCNQCQYPHNAQYTISHLGLGCRSGVSRYLGNTLLIMAASILLLTLRNLIGR
ncbi:hypothetical protein L9F63_018675 [Diploptera punctata]|uniref:Uncharacterized protein n=1 Tax=Diploptera punctata TaxID=6984 RepID=A0AAD8EFG7_DIPPU|nr:hypothetical protein L9F63_018675 [Diploptera punctata]